MSRPRVTIAINSYKNPELLRLSLQALREHLQRVSFSYEILVADSATEEVTEMLLREEFPEVRFFPHRENVGFGRLINRSIEEARGEYIFLMNADIIVQADTIPKLLAFAEAHPEVGILGPKQINFNGETQETCYRFYQPLTILYRRTFLGKLTFGKRHLDWFAYHDYDHQAPKEVDWVLGSALFCSKAHAEKIGPMDSRFFMYMEDVDWCRRFWKAGLSVLYYPEAVAHHYHARGSARGGFFLSLLMNRLTWYHIESALKYFIKYRGEKVPHT